MAKKNLNWIRRQTTDPYVKQANVSGFRSRAAYKLIGLDERFDFLKKSKVVLDLGAAPGSWSQVAVKRCSADTKIIALDLLPIEPIKGVTCIQGDFLDIQVREAVNNLLNNKKADTIISDISPNLSGIKTVDQLKAAAIIEMIIFVSKVWLQNKGILIIKIFNGSSFQQMLELLKTQFLQVKVVKPPASRSESKEVYLYACGLIFNDS